MTTRDLFKGKRRGPQKNAKGKARGIQRKAANVARNPKSYRQRGLTVAQRLAELDQQYGRGVGAAKERAKLMRLLRVSRQAPGHDQWARMAPAQGRENEIG